jgi:hypothetical protein
LVAAFNGVRSPSSGFPNNSRSELPASHSKSSQLLKRSSLLSHSLTGRLTATDLLYDWRFTANQFVLPTNPLRLTTNNFIFQLRTCGSSLCVTSSLPRGSVCRLQLLLILASAVILRSESRGTRDHILLSQIRDSLNLGGGARSPYLYPPGTGFPFRRLLRLVGLRWRFSTPPPHGIKCNKSKSKSKLCYDRRSVGQSVLE